MYTLQDKAGKDHDAIMKEARAAGFNTTCFYAYTVESVMPLLDAAARNDIKAFVYPTIPFSVRKQPLSNDDIIRDVKARMNHPALLGSVSGRRARGDRKGRLEPGPGPR